MKPLYAFTIILALLGTVALCASSTKITLQAEDAILNHDQVEAVKQSSFKSGKGVSLKPNAKTTVDTPNAKPDLIFTVNPSASGRYLFKTHAAVNSFGQKLMAKGKTKHDSLFMKIAVEGTHASHRVVFVPWSKPESCVQTTGKFELTDADQEIRIWLPKGVELDYIEISPYSPPAVPKLVSEYQPEIVPPAHHPRLWVNQESLPQIRQNLTKSTNAALWAKVQAEAEKPYTFQARPGIAVKEDPTLENAAVNKAFVYLMNGDKNKGRQSVALIHDYLNAVEFGNILDVTREIGRAIYAAARVYDWCYDLMTEQERQDIHQNMMRLADDMEIGWPPFKQGIVNGHGSEAQLLCHLLAMSIAIYDEDPLPYQYCSYRILEEHLPMRNFEYQSPRHSQGISYGIYRFGWDMHAAWLLYRMSGHKVYDSNIEDVRKYWLYNRLPGMTSFADGDGTAYGSKKRLGSLALLISAYANDPIMKRDFVNQGGLPNDPITVLLLDDPDLLPAKDLTSLPHTLHFGPVVGGMVARTGWNMDKKSSDVIVAMTGGGYHFGNHQHADAGSFQIYYHGIQVADLGEYVFYGTPYDSNFNKRSIAHSMMLAYDPTEQFDGGKLLNDGGARFEHSSPRSPSMVKKDPRYDNGQIISADFGPSAQTPLYSYFSVDLTSVYSKKVRNYIRTFCFLNLEDSETPATLIVLDHMETSGPEVKKYWQVNTLNKPVVHDDELILTNSEAGQRGNVHLQMLRPTAKNRHVEILSGADATSVFGQKLTPPSPDAPQSKGHRVMFSPTTPQKTDTFLTVMTMAESDQALPPVNVIETTNTYALTVEDRVVVLSKTGKLLNKAFTVDTHLEKTNQLILTGLKAGTWRILKTDGLFHMDIMINENKNTTLVKLPKGSYKIEPKP